MNLLQLLLYPFSILYGLITGFRNLLFNFGILPSPKYPVWIISIGNLSTGGTGKTPHTEYFARLMEEMSKDYEYLNTTLKNSAILSRGYRRKSKGFLLVHPLSSVGEVGDEPVQLRRRLDDILIGVDKIRNRGIQVLISVNRQLRMVLLDDAFQHRFVKPDISILLTKYDKPFYNDHVLPAGNLREWKIGYKRADIIVVTSAPPNLSNSEKKLIIKNIAPTSKQKVFFSSITYGEPANVYRYDSMPPILNKELSVLLLTGIAHPEHFKNYLEEKVKEVIPLRFKDHYFFTPKDINKVLNKYREITNPNKVIITTEKDIGRLDAVEIRQQFGDIQVLYVPIKVYVHEERELKETIFKLLSNTTLYQTFLPSNNPSAKGNIKLQKLA